MKISYMLAAALLSLTVTTAAHAAPCPCPPVRPILGPLTVTYATVAGVELRADLYTPEESAFWPVVVVVHGGGWWSGSRTDMSPWAVRLAQAGLTVVNVDYRLAPAHIAPAAVEDVRLALAWVRANIGVYGGDANRIAIFGASAGAHIAMRLGTTDAAIRGVASWSGPVDLATLSVTEPGSPIDLPTQYVGFDKPCSCKYPPEDPSLAVTASTAPTALWTSDNESIPLSQAQRMYDALGVAGVQRQLVVYPGTRHALFYDADAWPGTLDWLLARLQ